MIYALHGMLGGPEDWDVLGLDEVVALNLWDYQGTLEEVGAQIAQEVADRSDPEPVLMGYSMGGRIALHALLAQPDLWKRVVIISAHPGFEVESERAARRESDSAWAKKVVSMDWRAFLKEWNAQPVFAGQPPSPVQLALESSRMRIAKAFEDWSLGKQESFTYKLSNSPVPIDWVTGEKDSKFTQLASRMGEMHGTVNHHIVGGCAHRVIFEKPQAIAELCARQKVACPQTLSGQSGGVQFGGG